MMETTRQGPMASEPSPNEHHLVWAMLAWIANDTATPEQRTQAAAHLQHCDDCRAELVAQQQLRRALLTQMPAVSLGPDEGLQRLLGRIDAPLREQPMPTAPPQRKRSPLLMAMAAAIAVQAVGLGVLSVEHYRHADDAEFRMLSQSETAPKIGTLRVVPSAAMTMVEWDALLQSLGLRMVDGPNSVGAYTLASAPGATLSTSDQLARLRHLAGIRLVEQINP
jgi:hypothetical protein